MFVEGNEEPQSRTYQHPALETWESFLKCDIAESLSEAKTVPDAVEALSELRMVCHEPRFEWLVDHLVGRGLGAGDWRGADTRVREWLLEPLRGPIKLAYGTESVASSTVSFMLESGRTRLRNERSNEVRPPCRRSLHRPVLIGLTESDQIRSFGDTSPSDVPGFKRACYGTPAFDLYGQRFRIVSVESVDPRKVPHLAFCNKVFAFTCANPRNGLISGTTIHVGYRNGVFLNGLNRPASELMATQVRFGLGRSFCERYEWTAEFDVGGTFDSMALPIMPADAAVLFRTRDKFPGKARRSALINLVSAHRRRRKAPPDSQVREHFRGATRFDRNGLAVTITPSVDDAERIDSGRAVRSRNGGSSGK